MNIVLHEVENAVNMMAPDCSSWGIPCRGTSGRSFFNYQGFEQYGFVDIGNRMISRSLGCRIFHMSICFFLGSILEKAKHDHFRSIPALEACGYMPHRFGQEMHLHYRES